MVLVNLLDNSGWINWLIVHVGNKFLPEFENKFLLDRRHVLVKRLSLILKRFMSITVGSRICRFTKLNFKLVCKPLQVVHLYVHRSYILFLLEKENHLWCPKLENLVRTVLQIVYKNVKRQSILLPAFHGAPGLVFWNFKMQLELENSSVLYPSQDKFSGILQRHKSPGDGGLPPRARNQILQK